MLIVMTKMMKMMMMMMMMNETYLHTWSELMLVVLVDISEFLAFPSTLIHPQGRLAKMQISSGVQFVLQRMPQHLGPHYLPAAHFSTKHFLSDFPGWPAPGYLTAKVSTQSQRRGNLILEGFSRASQGLERLHELLRPWDFSTRVCTSVPFST